MKNIDTIIGLVVIILLVAILAQRCGDAPTVQPDSYEEIRKKMDAAFDTIQTEIMGSILADISILQTYVGQEMNNLTLAQKELMQRVIESEKLLREENKVLKNYLSIKTLNRDTIRERIIITDTSGVEVVVPDWFKKLPWQLRAISVDSFNYFAVKYDLLTDSIWADVEIMNDFEITEYELDDEYYIEVNDRNPRTYIMPGGGSFKLDLPKQKEKYNALQSGIQLGIGITSDLKPRPYVGIGLNYSPRLSTMFKNIFRKKN